MPSLPASSPLPLPRQPRAQHSIAHRMADDVGAAIVSGALADGARLLEEDLAAHYGTSRSPVREAIALLERRGLVRTQARRGTHVVGLTPALITDLFNVRGVLMGLAARYVAQSIGQAQEQAQSAARARAEQGGPQALIDVRQVTQTLADTAAQPDTTPQHFAKAASGLGAALLHHCGSDVLRRMVGDHGHLTNWGMLWHERPVDFLAPARRQALVQDYEALCRLLAAADEAGSERLLRTMLDDNRNHALAAWHAANETNATNETDTANTDKEGLQNLPRLAGAVVLQTFHNTP